MCPIMRTISSALLLLSWRSCYASLTEMSNMNCDPAFCTAGQPNVALSNIQDNYGCWCYFAGNFVRGKGAAQDSIDSLCKNLHRGYRCCIIDDDEVGVDCDPGDVTYNIFTLTSDDDFETQCTTANPSADACTLRTCIVEHSFMWHLGQLLADGFSVDVDNQHVQGNFLHADTCVGIVFESWLP